MEILVLSCWCFRCHKKIQQTKTEPSCCSEPIQCVEVDCSHCSEDNFNCSEKTEKGFWQIGRLEPLQRKPGLLQRVKEAKKKAETKRCNETPTHYSEIGTAVEKAETSRCSRTHSRCNGTAKQEEYVVLRCSAEIGHCSKIASYIKKSLKKMK